MLEYLKKRLTRVETLEGTVLGHNPKVEIPELRYFQLMFGYPGYDFKERPQVTVIETSNDLVNVRNNYRLEVGEKVDVTKTYVAGIERDCCVKKR